MNLMSKSCHGAAMPALSMPAVLGAALLGAALLIAASLSSEARAGGLAEAGDLEHARANARAGGPVSERDTELLERYGCLSGTASKACKTRQQRSEYRVVRKPVR